MNQLLEWAPFLVFFGVYKLEDIYWATGALMIAYLVLLLAHRVRTGKFKTMHLITFAVVMVLGAATLAFHDRRFIQWKPTVLLAAGAVVFLGSTFIGGKPLARRMLESAFQQPIEIAPRAWTLLNSLWVIWLALLAVVNLYVAWNFSESTWVYFKGFGISIALFVFMVPQVFWLHGKTKPADALPAERIARLRERLRTRFAPLKLDVIDESHLHIGHAGAAQGHGHYRVSIVAEAFRGVAPVARHRMVYEAVGDLLKTDIHALAIEALPPP